MLNVIGGPLINFVIFGEQSIVNDRNGLMNADDILFEELVSYLIELLEYLKGLFALIFLSLEQRFVYSEIGLCQNRQQNRILRVDYAGKYPHVFIVRV
jgi:hypothetical protein